MSKTSSLFLRLALAFAFLYPAYGFWANPNDWVGYIPVFVKGLGLSQEMLLWGLLGVHVIIALWLLSGWRVFIPSFGAAVFLILVVYFNIKQLDVLFRDISLALAALALAFNSQK